MKHKKDKFAGVCERCDKYKLYVTELLGYDRICQGCINQIVARYDYAQYMAATGGTGNARDIGQSPGSRVTALQQAV